MKVLLTTAALLAAMFIVNVWALFFCSVC